MQLGTDMELIEGLPVLYIRSLKAVVAADLHLGYEGGMANAGAAIPKANLKSILDTLEKAIAGRLVERLIVVGDIKNDFSGVKADETNELRELAGFMMKKGIKIEVVKGNHDNFIEGYSMGLGMIVHNGRLSMGKYLFAHGDRPILKEKNDDSIATVIIGHLHPSIRLRSKAGTVERLRCFLIGRMEEGKSLMVLPAIGYFETGSDVNVGRGDKDWSPVMRAVKVNEMDAIAVGHGTTLRFGRIKDLRAIGI